MTTLVLLPGLDGTGELFARFVDAFSGVDARVIAYPADRAMDYAEHEAMVRDKLPSAGDYWLLAESFSGPIGISIAASRPAGLRGLILCCTFASNPLPLFGPLANLFGKLPAIRMPPALAAPWLYAGRATPELRRAHSRAMARVAPATLRARVAAILAVDYRPLLRRIEVPTLYLRAKADRLIPVAAGRSILESRPDFEVAEFDAPHFLLQTEPEACARAVEQFMNREAMPDPPLDAEQSLRVSKLKQEELWEMDRVLLAQASPQWRKVARIVGGAIKELSARIQNVPDIYYAQRVRHLVEVGKLESEGDLRYMGRGEVRLPAR